MIRAKRTLATYLVLGLTLSGCGLGLPINGLSSSGSSSTTTTGGAAVSSSSGGSVPTTGTTGSTYRYVLPPGQVVTPMNLVPGQQ
jgi:hypothetical protein